MSRPVPRLVRDARNHADDEVVQDGPPAGVARQQKWLSRRAMPDVATLPDRVSRETLRAHRSSWALRDRKRCMETA